jgi:DNA-binding MarR family transcriptional regulator
VTASFVARSVRDRSVMHAIFFGLKRAHHSTLRLTRRALGAMGLTAARFDMLYAIMKSGDDLAQSALRKLLGVSRATVSRMLGSLEQLGLVMRKAHWFDRRKRIVALTAEGRSRIISAHRHFTRSGWAQLAVDSALCCDPYGSSRWSDESECTHATGSLEGWLHCICRAFYDRATLDYPWSPEDIVTWWDLHDVDGCDDDDDTPEFDELRESPAS